MTSAEKRGSKEALLVIDVQNCFLPGGTLAVEGGEQLIPIINQLRQKFEIVAFTRDWHPPNHVSFASMHQGLNPFDEINLNYDDNGRLCKSPTTNISEKVCEESDIKYKVKQQVFVDHCIMDTPDAALNSQLETKNSDIFVNNGYNHEVDSYSAFFNNGGFENTEMEEELDKHQIGKVYVVGIALDYCVFYSAMDSKKLGYETFLVKDATRGITSEGIEHALDEMTKAGIKIVTSDTLMATGNTSKEEL
jgi:nicotinamidase/pyrazinamidase